MPQFQTSDDVTLAYTDEGVGTPVILVAGFTAPATSWYFQEQALLAAGYRVIGFDRRNHGLSETPTHGQRLSRHGKDLHELLDALGLDAAYLVGGSMGASAIWAYLDLFGYDRCLGMASVDQTPKMLNADGWDNGFYGLTPENVGTFFEAGIPQTGRGLGIEKTLVGLSAMAAAIGAMPVMGDAADPVTRPLLQDHAAADWRDVLVRSTVPILMIAGADSQYWPSDHATWMAKENPLVSAVVIDACGHAANFDEPDAVNRALLAFVGR